MPFVPGDSQIFAPLFSDPAIADVFSDAQFVRRLLEVEAALARVEGRLGVIPAEAAQTIDSASASLAVDLDRLRAAVERDGFPIVELVRQLREHVGRAAADFVHRGATTQDILDTALVLQIRAALEVMEPLMFRLMENLAALAQRHRRTLMAGRTHGQQALPITFGFKVAGWLAPLIRHRSRLSEMKPRLLVVQLGGATGTLAALGESGLRVQAALADELGLSVLPMPWHTQRDTLAELAGWLSLVSGALAKMAQDILLLTQTEVAEVREGGEAARGGSSTMPQKRNPITGELILAAARANASLLASMHQALVQEHERGTHGWQLEWLALPQMFGLTTGALRHAGALCADLVVNEARMRENVRASNGVMLAEAASLALAGAMGLAAARTLVAEACQIATTEKRPLSEVLQERTEIAVDWSSFSDESAHLGQAEAFIARVLADYRDGAADDLRAGPILPAEISSLSS
jgi:3-carboxy-cis,cis-muconate cycloisomerase